MFTAKSFSYEGWNAFAYYLLLSCWLLFSWPVITGLHLSYDDNITYWFGSSLFWWMIPIPFWFLAVYAVKIILRPKKSLIMGSMVIPSVVIFLLGGMLMSKSGHLASKLRNRDCGTFPLIHKLEMSLWDAQEKRKECLSTATHPNVLFSSCKLYESGLKEEENERHWPYLEYLESQFECTGFCIPGEPIWMYSKEAGKDPCASALALFMETQVQSASKQMMGFSILLVFVTVGWVFATKPTVAENRREKKRREALFGPDMREQDFVFKLPDVHFPGFSFFKKKQPSQGPLFQPSPPPVQQAVSAPPAFFQYPAPYVSSPPLQPRPQWVSSPPGPVQVQTVHSPLFTNRSYSADSLQSQ